MTDKAVQVCCDPGSKVPARGTSFIKDDIVIRRGFSMTQDRGQPATMDWARARSIFSAAVDLPAGQRQAFLEAECGDDLQLLAGISELLQAAEHTDGAFERIIQEAAAEIAGDDVGRRIGQYEILELLGEGGMGDVFLARRAEAGFSQRVAIKVMRSSRASQQALSRFRAERQILANLEHPNIARLIDGGETASGRPYLVMEYVPGRPVTDYCIAEELPVRNRLTLFLRICSAVQHAHQNLIIHRDIKPSNIIVNESGEPKLLDFGIAKLTDPAELDVTLAVTQDGSRMMTPLHASPEQVRGETITTATDIYSLGALLYELLCDRFPYSLNDSRPSTLEQVICEVDPLPPSRRFAEAGRDGSVSTTTSANELKRDLDNIVAKAMHKDARRRYVSVDALIADIEAYLDKRPISATGDSPLYVAHKFVARNRIAAAFMLTLVVMTGLYMWQLGQQRDIAEAQRRAAEQAQEQAEEVTEFMVGLFEGANPGVAKGETLTAREMLDVGRERIEGELVGQPILRSRVLGALAAVYRELGDYEASMAIAEKRFAELENTIGGDHAETLLAQLEIGDEYIDAERYDDALAHLNRAEEQVLAAELDSIDRQKMLAEIQYLRGNAYYWSERIEEALIEHQSALEIREEIYPPEATQRLRSLNSIASALGRLDRHAEGLEILQEVLAIRRRVNGNDHMDTAVVINNIGYAHTRLGNYEEGRKYLEESLATRKRLLDPGHYLLLGAERNIVTSLLEQRKYAEAKPIIKDLLERYTDHVGSRLYEYCREAYAYALFETQDYAAAGPVILDVLEYKYQEWPEGHYVIDRTHRLYAETMITLGNVGEADRHVEIALASQRKNDNPGGEYALSQYVKARVLEKQGRFEEAVRLANDALAMFTDTNPDHPNLGKIEAYAKELRGTPD